MNWLYGRLEFTGNLNIGQIGWDSTTTFDKDWNYVDDEGFALAACSEHVQCERTVF